MQRRWVGKNVDLSKLSQEVEDFFKNKSFLTKREQFAKECTILWAPWSPEHVGINVNKAPKVRIVGEPNDFTIDIIASELTKRQIRLGMLTKPFGGGYFLLQGLRLKEALQKIENEFWTYIENEITSLTNSAKR